MGQRGPGWSETSQEAMDAAAREQQVRLDPLTFLSLRPSGETCPEDGLPEVPGCGHRDRSQGQSPTTGGAGGRYGGDQVTLLLLLC